MRARQRRLLVRTAFTLVEVIVVIAIIGVLIALLLPAVQAARESSRRSACANNLHQLALAVKQHEEAHRTYPTGGWGADWVGDPDAGFGPNQPGGWIYNVLPFMEEKQLRELGRGQPAAAKRASAAQLLQSPIPVLFCPSRRAPILYPYHGSTSLKNVDPPANVAKGDYAINGQISYAKSEVTLAEIQRRPGVSKMLLLGEKSVARQHYDDGRSPGDMLAMFVGDCDDIRRSATGQPISDDAGGTGFGSAHSGGCNIAMGDGAVRFVSASESLQP